MKIHRPHPCLSGLVLALVLPASLAQAHIIYHDGFNSSESGAGGSTGIYKANTALDISPNNTLTGGETYGYDAARPWVTGSYFRANPAGLNGDAGSVSVARGSTNNSVRHANRQLSDAAITEISSSSVLYASVRLQLDSTTPNASDIAMVGFSSGTADTNPTSGAFVGFVASGTGWDLQARFYGTGAVNDSKTVTLASSVDVSSSWLIVWKMDEANNTISFWLNPTSENDAATVSSTSFTSTGVQNIRYARAFARLPGSPATDAFYFDNLSLGTTWADVAPVSSNIPEPSSAALLGGAAALGLVATSRKGKSR